MMAEVSQTSHSPTKQHLPSRLAADCHLEFPIFFASSDYLIRFLMKTSNQFLNFALIVAALITPSGI